jgi:hypothetical protein
MTTLKQDAMATHYPHDEDKLETSHHEILRSDSDEAGAHPEYRTYDPKWEAKTLRKIDARLLIIRECLFSRLLHARTDHAVGLCYAVSLM